MNFDHYFATAREREQIRRNRLAGITPWTNDPIFKEWRFTNVHRENDKTTIWFRENVRKHLSGLAVVEATLIFRWFNRIETGEKIVDLLLNGWNTEEARKRLLNVSPLVTGAYMVHSPYGYNKLDGLLWAIANARPHLATMVPKWGKSQEAAWRDLCTLNNMGSFSAGEVIWDLRWTDVLDKALDIPTWTIAGPGCAKGIGYLTDEPFKYNYGSKSDQIIMLKIMQEVLELSRDPNYWPSEWEPWELHEAEMWFCEWCKIRNAMEGKRLKRRFP